MPTADEKFHEIEAQIDKMLMPGWTKQWVEPPWAGTPPACRGCGLDCAESQAESPGKKFTLGPMTFADKKKKIMWYSAVLFCEPCSGQKPVRDRVAVDLFAPLMPPDVGPSGPSKGSSIIIPGKN